MKTFKSTFLFILATVVVLLKNSPAEACSFTPTFTGDTITYSGSTVNYLATSASGHYYRWEVTGGTIVSGSGTDSIMVSWPDPLTGTVKLIDSTASCYDSVKKSIRVDLSGPTLAAGAYTAVGSYSSISGKTNTVTTSNNNENGAIWHKYQISLEKNFDFTFITNQNGSADGMMFILQNTGLSAYNSGGQGSDMGYYNAGTGIMDESVGVEEDIYQSSSTYYDSSASHLSLVKDKDPTPLRAQYYVSSTLGGGKDHKLRITWNRDAYLLQVYLDGSKIYSWHNNLIKNVFKGNPKVWFGFTGATGGSVATQTFKNDTLIYGEASILASSDIVCTGDTATLMASAGIAYKWSNGDTSRIIKVTKSGIYSVEVTDSSHFKSTAYSDSIQVLPKPTASFATSDFCLNNNIPLTNNSSPSTGLTYLWKFGSGDTSTQKTPTHYYSKTGTYTINLTVNNGGCSDTISHTATANRTPSGMKVTKGMPYSGKFNTGNVKDPDKICSGDTDIYSFGPPKGLLNSDYGTKWIINGISFQTASGATTKDTAFTYPTSSANAGFRFTPTSAIADSTFILNISVRTMPGNCDSVITRYISVLPKPKASFSTSDFCLGTNIPITNSTTPSTGVSYLYKFGNGDSSTISVPLYYYRSAGSYTVTLNVANAGCSDQTSHSVTAYPKPSGITFAKSSPFSGQFNTGDNIDPDIICVGDTNVYQFSCPKGLSNSDYNSKWTIAGISFQTPFGTKTSDTLFKYPTSSKNASFLFSPTRKFADSLFVLNISVKTLPGNCDSLITRYIQVRPKATSKFGFTNNCQGFALSFNDSSTVSGVTNITDWKWDFGDGASSVAQNPKHTYAKPGTYTVSLSASSNSGCSVPATRTVTQYPSPKASFGVNPGCQDIAIAFPDSSSVSSGSVKSWSWNFGDGSAVSASQNPTHAYTKSGPYNVKLVVMSDYGCKDSTVKMIRVQPKPHAGFTYLNACVGSTVYIANTSSDSTSPTTYNWDFGDGSTSTNSGVSHIYKKNGTYKLALTVTSKNGCTDTTSQNITPSPIPVPNFYFTNACSGVAVAFSDSSTNGAGTIYSWNFGDGKTDIGKSANTNHAFAKAGTYNVILNITNGYGCTDTQSHKVVVSDYPKAGFVGTDVCLGKSTSFTNTTTGSGSLNYSWNFGDGSKASTAQNPVYTYKAVGAYTVKLSATNTAGCSDSISKTVKVNALPVVGKWNISIHNFTVKFFPQDTTLGSYVWYFGNGDSSSKAKPVYTYSSVHARYFVKLMVTNASGCSDFYADSVDVGATGILPGSNAAGHVNIYPNPFEGNTTISYSLTERSRVNLSVYDMQGKQVAQLTDAELNAGSYSETFDARKYHVGEGVYLLKMIINNHVYTTKLVNMR